MNIQLPFQFFVRRKSDGKYYLNGGYHARIMSSIDDSKDYSWTDNLQTCKPFKSISGAKNSIGRVYDTIVGQEANQLIKQYVPAKFYGLMKFDHNGYKYEFVQRTYINTPPYQKLIRIVKFNDRYEIVEVKVSIEIKK